MRARQAALSPAKGAAEPAGQWRRRQTAEPSRDTSAIIGVGALVLIAALALGWRPGPLPSGTEHPREGQASMAAAAGHREDAMTTPRVQDPAPAEALGGTRVSAAPLPALTSGGSRIPAHGHSQNHVAPAHATPRGDLAEPAETDEDIKGGYLAIGESMTPEVEDLVGQAPVGIGDVLDADDPDAGPSAERVRNPIRLGDPLDADLPMDEAGDIQAEPNRIGEPLAADEADELGTN